MVQLKLTCPSSLLCFPAYLLLSNSCLKASAMFALALAIIHPEKIEPAIVFAHQ
jgi:hypothetical protein